MFVKDEERVAAVQLPKPARREVLKCILRMQELEVQMVRYDTTDAQCLRLADELFDAIGELNNLLGVLEYELGGV